MSVSLDPQLDLPLDPAETCVSGSRRVRMRLATLFWLQLLLSPLFLSPLSQRIDFRSRPNLALLAFLVAPLVYTTIFPWLARRRGSRRLSWGLGAAFGMLFGVLGFLPHATVGIVGLSRAFDPALPIRRWTVIAESLQMIGVLLFFAAFYGLVGLAGGGLVRAAEVCGLIRVASDRPRRGSSRS